MTIPTGGTLAQLADIARRHRPAVSGSEPSWLDALNGVAATRHIPPVAPGATLGSGSADCYAEAVFRAASLYLTGLFGVAFTPHPRSVAAVARAADADGTGAPVPEHLVFTGPGVVLMLTVSRLGRVLREPSFGHLLVALDTCVCASALAVHAPDAAALADALELRNATLDPADPARPDRLAAAHLVHVGRCPFTVPGR